jgi:hypothetical protein
MTTVDLITALFYEVDEQLRTIPKHPEAHLWPSEVVTLGLLHALKGVGNRPFYRWLTRDYRPDTVGQPLVGDKSTSQTCFSALSITEIIFVVENRNAPPKPSEAIGERSLYAVQTAGVSGGRSCTGARAAKREVRVVARGRSSSQATIRSILMAAAVATCCKCVFAKPR